MPSKQINVAIIGAGFISDYHINGIRAAGGGTITTLVGRRLERTARRAAEFGIPRHSTAYHDVLADPRVDAVVIATPDATHMPLSIEALQAGKPVLLALARGRRAAGRVVLRRTKLRKGRTPLISDEPVSRGWDGTGPVGVVGAIRVVGVVEID